MDTQAPAWIPPHCPNPNCKYHIGHRSAWPFRKHGFYRRRIPPHRIQRFTCLSCGRSFSTQTFDVSYWLKRPDLLPGLMTKIAGGMANRQIARDARVSPSTVDRQLSRLGRHCLLFHRLLLRTVRPPTEIAFDGFETFELSQYYPTHFHICVEPRTSFFNHFTDSELRRKGRMTARQKQRRRELEARHGRPDPGAVRKDVSELLSTVLAGAGRVIVRTDLHRTYPIVLRELTCKVIHEVVSSRRSRNRGNLLWEINRLDRMIRHSQAGHMRETLSWPKRRQRAAERLAIFLVWWNYVKRRFEKGGRATPGMLKGITDRRLSVTEILGRRLFRTRLELPQRWRRYYDGEIRTRALARNGRHTLKYAY